MMIDGRVFFSISIFQNGKEICFLGNLGEKDVTKLDIKGEFLFFLFFYLFFYFFKKK